MTARAHTRAGKLIAILAVVAGGIMAILPSSPAFAASSSASRDNFQGQCDALVIVSDYTSYGNVEVFGGFSCPTGHGLWNRGTPTTIKVSIFLNGVEVKNSTFTCPDCIQDFWTCSSESWQVTYPDYSSNDRFKGKMVITSLGGSVTLTTGEIVT